MTLEELKIRCEENGFKYAYGLFKEPTSVPYIVATTTGGNQFFADNKVYYTKPQVDLIYTYADKNSDEIEKIEKTILSDIGWNRDEENYIASEEVWQLVYHLEI